MEDTTSADVWSRIDNTAEWPHFIIGELINLALNCINVDLNKRPPFSQITQVLDKILEIEDWTNAETTRLIINQPNTINNIKNDLDHLSPSTIGSDNVVVAAHFGPNWDTLVLEDRHHQESALQGHYHDGEHNDQDDDEEEDSDDDDSPLLLIAAESVIECIKDTNAHGLCINNFAYCYWGISILKLDYTIIATTEIAIQILLLRDLFYLASFTTGFKGTFLAIVGIIDRLGDPVLNELEQSESDDDNDDDDEIGLIMAYGKVIQ
ncbi:hypothetical protein Pmar_PMAR009728 [Perkinsus marinus ATCC 50983]|uniref:Uncharacterized protein n=1 Tax=Perkinsus marinus (strain ATCC 50983 / TXsc) TaxID=423536 RepID=C5L238_PERM5|nr:hypothetical protein Pmar_PMAR009728 [Perkinsus marinus ATCC 50983]EER09231.1 hypothetical protein Pmar_PMAR009728 [Perkinsus marinus ATCC 50983]|eukprot:XP_002777415.1 hypothetical protein Pmar_PMAR009728 [Perkinsus marinus ATCC 50983]